MEDKNFQETFRVRFPCVSLQQVDIKGSNKVTQSVEKRSPVRTTQNNVVVGLKPSVGVQKSPALVKTASNSPKVQTTNLNVKQSVAISPKTTTLTMAKAVVAAKPYLVAKTPVGPKTPAQVITKGKVTTPVPQKAPVPILQMAKTPVTVKSPTVKTPTVASPMKTVPQKVAQVKTAQHIVKQQSPNVSKVPGKPTIPKEDIPDQSTTVVNYQMPQVTQCTSNQ